MDMIGQTYAIAQELADKRHESPAGVSFLVVTDSEPVALLVAPMLAKRLHPTTAWGRVLHSEACDGGWEIVLEDLGSSIRYIGGHAR